ncbi:hypothetical protein LCGC14_2316090 [marine sediment metagenome]|uniref:Uncharacterized protein n=1 Tax=marine sediment metagenome TaxID=412755 RepID=A0A0F9D6Q8_9ZZZZ
MTANSEEDLLNNDKKLQSLAILARFIRAHPDNSWPEIVAIALGGGYTEADINTAGWCVGVELVNRTEEEALNILARRN